MTNTTTGRRRYRSQLRSDQARTTRRRILDSAADSFTRLGYAGTTLADVAASTGVSLETVKAQGAKRDLLVAAFQQSFTGSEDKGPLMEQAAAAGIMELADATEFLRQLVAFMTEANKRSYGVWRAFRSAAAADAAIAENFQKLITRRNTDIAATIKQLQSRDMIRNGLQQRREMTASTIFLLSAEGYEHFVVDFRWSEQRYRDWVIKALTELVLKG